MRIAVVALGENKSDRLKRAAQSLGREFRAMGHDCEIFETVDTRLSSSEFLVFCAHLVPAKNAKGINLAQALAKAGSLAGRRSMAILLKSGLFPNRQLGLFMKLLEKEGVILTMAEIVSNESQIIAAARGAPLVRG